MGDVSEVEYDASGSPDPTELLAFYGRQNHATTQSLDKLQSMVDASFCFVVARRGGEMIGLARGITDGVRGHLVECKLDPSCQGPACVTHTDGRIEHDTAGIAREMAQRVIAGFRERGVERVDVLAHETEVDFCAELGFKKAAGLMVMKLNPQG